MNDLEALDQLLHILRRQGVLSFERGDMKIVFSPHAVVPPRSHNSATPTEGASKKQTGADDDELVEGWSS